MLFWVIICVLVLLAWFEIIPVRLWIAQAKTKYYGKTIRFKISIIKLFEPFINWLDSI